MVPVIATFEVLQGQEAAFEAVFLSLQASVIANEPGVKLYQLVRAKRQAGVYKVIEIYTDKDAVKAHAATDYFQAAFPKLLALCAGDPAIEMFDSVD